MRSFVLTGCSGVASDKAAPFSDRPGRMLLPAPGPLHGGETALPGQGAARPLRGSEGQRPSAGLGAAPGSGPENSRPVRAPAYGEHAVERRVLFGIVAAAVDAAPAFPALERAQGGQGGTLEQVQGLMGKHQFVHVRSGKLVCLRSR